jgi:hypothetical protein
MVAMLCPDKQGDKLSRLFHNQYMSSTGKWATDFDHKATCRTDKVEILEYCKKVSIGKSTIMYSIACTSIVLRASAGRKVIPSPNII